MLQLGLFTWKGHRKQVNLQACELTITELLRWKGRVCAHA